MPVQHFAAEAERPSAKSRPPLSEIVGIDALTIGPGGARAVNLERTALLIYVRFGVLGIETGVRRSTRALPGELVLIDGESEFRYANASKAEELNVLEIRLEGPKDEARLQQRYFSDDEKRNKLCTIASPAGARGSLALRRPLAVSLTALAKWDTVLSDLDKSSAVWVIALSGEVTVNNEKLVSGDSALVTDADELRVSGLTRAEVMAIEGSRRDTAPQSGLTPA